MIPQMIYDCDLLCPCGYSPILLQSQLRIPDMKNLSFIGQTCNKYWPYIVSRLDFSIAFLPLVHHITAMIVCLWGWVIFWQCFSISAQNLYQQHAWFPSFRPSLSHTKHYLTSLLKSNLISSPPWWNTTFEKEEEEEIYSLKVKKKNLQLFTI